MSGAFSFSFTGDDIEEDGPSTHVPPTIGSHAAESGTLRKSPTPYSAFPISGLALLPAQTHALSELLARLPSKISYSTLAVSLDDGSTMRILRREWWDVRVQLMAEADEADEAAEVGLGGNDIKTGVYEGGFKSWESSVDLVKVLAGRRKMGGAEEQGRRVLEIGCGTALPSLALLQWQLCHSQEHGVARSHLDLGLADYNPSVLQLVTVPNLLLTWAQCRGGTGFELEGELAIDEDLLGAFHASLSQCHITLSFYSGAWSPSFVHLIKSSWSASSSTSPLLVLAAETIYSPMALQAFADSLMGILDGKAEDGEATSLVAAKKVYFGVGGSMEDFVAMVKGGGLVVEGLREEEEGVRRAVVEVKKGDGVRLA